MKRFAICIVLICIILGGPASFIFNPLCAEEINTESTPPDKAGMYMDNYAGPTVLISGRVFFPSYKEGQRVRVTASSKSLNPTGISAVDITGPGDYSLQVPQNVSDVFVEAIVLDSEGNSKDERFGTSSYSNNPVQIKDADIREINIGIFGKPIMATYQGPTVSISGKVIFPDYKEGQRIFITIRESLGRGGNSIANANIAGPGDYSIQVPQNIGDVYILATVMQPGEKIFDSSFRSINNKSPFKVESSDIEGVDIKLFDKMVMDTYQGPTVSISGKVIFPDYKEGQHIRILLKSFAYARGADIANIAMPGPGDYSAKVPQNFGDIYISATVLQPGEEFPSSNNLDIEYNQGEPVKVGTSDIPDIDIALP